jgi:hypothetical protein
MHITKLHKLLDPEIRAKNLQAARWSLRERWWHIAHPRVPDPVFVVGCSRSGTTVTYETLAATSSLRSFGYEIPQLWNRLCGPAHSGWESEAADAASARPQHRDAALRYFYARLGSGRVLDKSCINVMRIPYLRALFPQAVFVYIHRDGRDNISSLMDGWRERGRFDLRQYLGPLPAQVRINDGEFDDWCFFLPPGWREYNQARLEEVCAYQWITANRMALDAGSTVPPEQWIQVRYEDILERPVDMFRDVFERLEIHFDDQLRSRCSSLHRRPTSIVNGPPRRSKWRGHNMQAVERILERIRPMMRQLGYDPDD